MQKGSRACDDYLDQLLETPPEQFVAARKDLAAKLSAKGERKAAAEVNALSKPTVPVWAINQLARREPEKVAALLESASRLRSAQTGALKRRASGEDLRAAAQAERDALGELLRSARQLLREANRAESSGLLGRVESTLHALAIADPAEGELLRRGRVTREAQTVGFPGLGGPSASVPAAPVSEGGTARKTDPKELQRARAELRDAQRTAKHLRAAAAKAERTAERLRTRAEQVEGEAAKARDEAKAGEQKAADARRQLDEAMRQIDRASARLAASRAS